MRCFRVRALSENHTTRPAALVDQLVRRCETGDDGRLDTGWTQATGGPSSITVKFLGIMLVVVVKIG